MGNKLGWFALRTDADIASALEKVRLRAAKDDTPDAFRLVRSSAPAAGRLRRLLGLRNPRGHTYCIAVILGWEFHASIDWAQALSQELRCVGVSFLVFEGTWNYSIFDSGEEVAGMDVYSLSTPVLFGDVHRAASLFECQPDLFHRYLEAIKSVNADDEYVEPSYAFAGDKYSADDEWAHCEFAMRLAGVDYPGPGEGVEFRWKRDTSPVTSATWVGLPPRLSRSDAAR